LGISVRAEELMAGCG